MQAQSENKDRGRVMRAITADAFMDRKIPPREMILSPWLAANSLNLLHAWRGVGKTQLSLAIAIAVAAGGRIGPWFCDNPCPVLYVDGEMDPADLQSRFNHQSHGRDLKNLTLIADGLHEDGLPDLTYEDNRKKLDQYVVSGSLLVLDNISTLFQSIDENDATAWAGPADWLKSLRRRGVTVLLVHHDNKSGKQRGSSKKEDILNTVIGLRHPDGYEPSEGAKFEVHFEKARGMSGKGAEPFVLILGDDEQGRGIWLTEEIGMGEKDLAVELLKEGKKIMEVSSMTGLSKSAVGRIKQRMSV